MSDSEGLTQDLLDFTVQIRKPKNGAIVGTGIVVSMDGKVVTCAHVVEAAIEKKPPYAEDREIGVYFPQAREGEKERRARVSAFFEKGLDDDVVVLQLTGGPSPLGPEQIAVLGSAEYSARHDFQSYGYRRLDNYLAGRADGMIQGPVEPPPDRNLQVYPQQLKSTQINRGMSGAAVLDIQRNLVVGIVSEAYKVDKLEKSEDTAWAVDNRVLAFDPLLLPLRAEDLPKKPVPTPKTDITAARAMAAPSGIAWNNAPQPLDEWVGRVELLEEVTADWKSPHIRVAGLIGFGGEGKSSIARKWVDDLLENEANRPDGVFWWGFYTEPSVDKFFEAALEYMIGGKLDPRKALSASAKAQMIGAMFGAGRYLFVLDGLEILQYQEGDRYGLLTSKDLINFLEYFGGPEVKSFCLITSRAPMFDLMSYTSYRHRDVDRLPLADGRELLRKIGVKGKDAELDKVVQDWDGHALTLSLLGSCIAEKYDGDISKADIETPIANEDRYERVHRVLRRYDDHLDKAEKAFMTLFSAFRTPVKEMALEKVFRTKTKAQAINAPITELTNNDFDAMVKRLVAYRIIRYDQSDSSYTAHPLIRNHYLAQFASRNQDQTKEAHEHIKDYYLEMAGDTPNYPTLDDLAPLIEVVHHLCQAGAYDEAYEIRRDRIYHGDRRVIADQLGTFESAFSLMRQFFPEEDIALEPQVSQPRDKCWILNEVGLCLMNLGRLREAASFYERAIIMNKKIKGWKDASATLRNLADLYISLGELEAAAKAAKEALKLAQRATDDWGGRVSLVWQAWVEHQKGDVQVAAIDFKQAEKLNQKIDSDILYLYSLAGLWHADHLRRLGYPDYAHRVTNANVAICEQTHWADDLSRCHRVLGDLDAEAKRQKNAREHYDEAIKIARGIQVRDVLIEALLARGRWYAKYMNDPDAAFSDLNEAFEYAVDSGYRIHEADIRIGLAWAYLAQKDPGRAKTEADRAMTMSKEMGYHWGQVDAQEVLDKIKQKN